MREIKFRAWDNGNKEMYDIESLHWDDCTGEFSIRTTQYTDYFSLSELKLMQYIGVKDGNGIEIFEGDILEYVLRNVEGKEISREHYLVRECINGWELRNTKRPRQHKSLKFCFKYKVIGNIYNNPELLKAGD